MARSRRLRRQEGSKQGDKMSVSHWKQSEPSEEDNSAAAGETMMQSAEFTPAPIQKAAAITTQPPFQSKNTKNLNATHLNENVKVISKKEFGEYE